MHIINKKTFEIKYNIKNVTTKPFNQWAVIDDSVQLYDEIIDEEGETIVVPKYNKRYIDTLEFNSTVKIDNVDYMNCINIVECSTEEKDAIIAEELVKLELEKKIKSFECWGLMWNYKVTVPVALEEESHELHALYAIGEKENNPVKVKRDEDMNIISYTSFWMNLDEDVKVQMSKYPEVFEIEINPNYNK